MKKLLLLITVISTISCLGQTKRTNKNLKKAVKDVQILINEKEKNDIIERENNLTEVLNNLKDDYLKKKITYNVYKTKSDSLKKIANILKEEVHALTSCEEKKRDKAIAQAKKNCLELNFCDDTDDLSYNFSASLAMLKLKKNDYFSLNIKNVNPYRYDINITTKNDTVKTGTAPALFSAFMDISQLGVIAASINNFIPTVSIPPKDTGAAPSVQYQLAINNDALNWVQKTISDSISEEKRIVFNSTFNVNEIKIQKLIMNDNFSLEKNTLDSIEVVISKSLKGKDTIVFKRIFERYKTRITGLKKAKDVVDISPKPLTANDSICLFAKKIEDEYYNINTCYMNSILNVYNANIDCPDNSLCFKPEGCKCLENEIDTIKEIENNIYILSVLLNKQIAENTIDTVQSSKEKLKKLNFKKENNVDASQEKVKKNPNPMLKAEYTNLLTELQSSKYSFIYLNKIHAKAYANFLIAKNMEQLSTYHSSYPIQVQGDEIELKIDITPKAANKTSPKDSTKDKKIESNTSTNNLSNQSPVTININTDTKTVTPTPNKDAKKGALDNKPSSPVKKDSTNIYDKLSVNELQIVIPVGVKECHLNYKYRTSNLWYGFSAGFFVDWLYDETYVSKPVSPLLSNTTYNVVKENSTNPYKYGVMASVNGGCYFSKKSDWFFQMFAGPGLSIETKLQPRLLIGGGIGCGGANKFSINGGVSIGQVQRLSNVIDLSQQYAVPQTSLYYTKNAAAPFISINYVFGF